MNSTILDKAKKILGKNLYEVDLNGKRYRRTVPSKEFYIHQWNWDSATHAMGLVHFDEERAFDELRSLVSGQWENGLIAQITFNPNERKYYPGPEFWGTEKFANGEIITSGITQPPLLAISTEYVLRQSKNNTNVEKFTNEIVTSIIKYHNNLHSTRDPENSGLLTVIHPWESGCDNSPRWDSMMQRIKLSEIPDEVKANVNQNRSDDKIGDTRHRPGLEDYYRYMYLVDLYSKWDWEYNKIVKESPFRVKGILFNSIWCKANESLANILDIIGKTQDAKKYYDWAKETRSALIKSWDEEIGQFTDYEILGNKFIPIKENTITTMLPFLAKAVTTKQIKILMDKLNDPNQYKSAYPIPTTALNSNKFELSRYWRGPTWPITNLFVIEGLTRYLESNKCRKYRNFLVNSTVKMIEKNGFFEYYDPTQGSARPDRPNSISSLGFGNFSWSAAIYVYLVNEYQTVIE